MVRHVGTARMTRTAAQRGFLLLGLMQIAFGFALNGQQNIVTNYFDGVLHLAGPQFGYITAIREVPGFLLIFLSALFYRVSLQRVTAGALMLLAIAYALFGLSHSFWTVAPWVILSSMGYHTVLQTQNALALNLATEAKSGATLGRMNAINQGGSLAALIFIFITFHYGLLSFRPAFVILGVVALLGGIAVLGFPYLHDGEAREHAARRDPIVFRRHYRYYYFLTLIDGGRQQIFFSFGLYVLVHAFHLGVAQVSALLIAVTFAAMLAGPTIGRLIDTYGERRMLSVVNVAYIVALSGYAFTQNIIVACGCYGVYTFISPLSSIAASTYLRKVAVVEDIAPSFAMGTTMQHAAAIVVPVTAGIILNYAGYQIPFMIACGFACLNFIVTQRLDPAAQRSPARIAADNARHAATAAVEDARAGQPGGTRRPAAATGGGAD